jgi:hypothetical protein
MKRLMVLLAGVFFIGCSADNDVEVTEAKSVINEDYSGKETIAQAVVPGCFTTFSGHVSASQLVDPDIYFRADVTGGAIKVSYKYTLEVEMLADCEDITTGNGQVIRYNYPGLVTNPATNAPVITVDGLVLPQDCYRWRLVLKSTGTVNSCTSYTPWYEAPLY